MALKVAIVGLWSETRGLVPWDDQEWEKWGVAWDVDAFKMDRVFEPHAACEWPEYAKSDYIERLSMMPRLYLQEKHPQLPNSEAYPFDAVSQTAGDWLESSVAYMLALAIHEGAQEIGLYGVSMAADEEYGYQRPNAAYLVGLARGRGIKVHIPGQSSLCKYSGKFGYLGRYGKR
jgi:hypothetical protein